MKKFILLASLSLLALTARTSLHPTIQSLPLYKPVIEIKRGVLPLANSIHQTTTEEIPILMYHYIRRYDNISDQLGINLSVSPKEFAAQLDELEKLGYHTITFKDLAAHRLPARPVILSFDDGYQDFYDNALPELRKRHMKAVTYIIAGALNTPGYMTKAEVKELATYSIEVGDHTWTHPNLSLLTLHKLIWEITSSKKYLELLIKQSVISFAYPSGRYNDQVIRIAQESGYSYAVTTHSGEADLRKPLTLYRLRVGPKTSLNFLSTTNKISVTKEKNRT